jgi:hypothetical protein
MSFTADGLIVAFRWNRWCGINVYESPPPFIPWERGCGHPAAARRGDDQLKQRSIHASETRRMAMFRKFAVLLLGIAAPLAASADDSLAKFKGGIGVIPVSAGAGTAATAEVVNRNVARGVQPPGQPWVISDLSAEVKTDGSIRVRGRGLLLAGGNGVGGNGGQSVFATLICEAAAPFVEHSTAAAGVPLGPDGDFRIDDVLDPLPPIPCASPALFIRSTANRGWFAAGIPDLSD